MASFSVDLGRFNSGRFDAGRFSAGVSSTYSVTITGLTDGEARPGDHATIGFTTDPVGGTITQKWGSTSGGSQFGTGANPTDYSASVGGLLYLEVTRNSEVVNETAPIREVWILDLGAWEDLGAWDDTDVWKDS